MVGIKEFLEAVFVFLYFKGIQILKTNIYKFKTPFSSVIFPFLSVKKILSEDTVCKYYFS